MVAVPLLFGRLTAEDYEDAIANDERIDALREKIVCVEDAKYTADYHDANKRSIANALHVELNDGSILPEVVVEFPIGHRLRRADGIPLLLEKFERNLERRLSEDSRRRIVHICSRQQELEAMPVSHFVELFVVD
jgi:2-methylcitrate dehydratase